MLIITLAHFVAAFRLPLVNTERLFYQVILPQSKISLFVFIPDNRKQNQCFTFEHVLGVVGPHIFLIFLTYKKIRKFENQKIQKFKNSISDHPSVYTCVHTYRSVQGWVILVWSNSQLLVFCHWVKMFHMQSIWSMISKRRTAMFSN